VSTRIGILHPGQMGASVAAAARSNGAWVGWASEGRGPATRERAAAAGLDEVPTLEALASASEILISVCPPTSARDVAHAVAACGFGGLYVDANAVSPATAREIDAIVRAGGARFVDGGIIGLPPSRPGSTRLYLSGVEADTVAELFRGSLLEPVTIAGGPGAASAHKVCYAAWTKGSAALLVAIRALARAEGVEAPLLEEWDLSQQGLSEQSVRSVQGNAFKAWRFAGEMEEIAEAFVASGLPGGFHEAASDVYRRLAGYKDCDPPPAVEDALDTVLAEPGARETP